MNYTKTHYQILGVSNNATEAEIGAAYRKAVLKTHPDKTGQRSSEQFVKIKAAYEVLSNSSTRSTYDFQLRKKVPTSGASYYNPNTDYDDGIRRKAQQAWEAKKMAGEEASRRAAEKARAEEERLAKKKLAEENSRRAAERARAKREKAARERLAARRAEEFKEAERMKIAQLEEAIRPKSLHAERDNYETFKRKEGFEIGHDGRIDWQKTFLEQWRDYLMIRKRKMDEMVNSPNLQATSKQPSADPGSSAPKSGRPTRPSWLDGIDPERLEAEVRGNFIYTYELGVYLKEDLKIQTQETNEWRENSRPIPKKPSKGPSNTKPFQTLYYLEDLCDKFKPRYTPIPKDLSVGPSDTKSYQATYDPGDLHEDGEPSYRPLFKESSNLKSKAPSNTKTHHTTCAPEEYEDFDEIFQSAPTSPSLTPPFHVPENYKHTTSPPTTFDWNRSKAGRKTRAPVEQFISICGNCGGDMDQEARGEECPEDKL